MNKKQKLKQDKRNNTSSTNNHNNSISNIRPNYKMAGIDKTKAN